MKNILLFFGFALMIAGCQIQAARQTGGPNGNVKPSVDKYTLTPFTTSQSFPDANLKAISYENGKFMAVIAGTSYKLGEQTADAVQKSCANSKDGQHIHLIVDTEPYIAKYTPTFDQVIPDGDHYILAFLSRSYHESLKTPEAYQALKVTVKDKSFEKQDPITEPMLFYSRPKGLYTGVDGKKVMLDFYLVNTEMKGYKVEADINGEKHLLETWQPYYIEGLPEGDNTITLTLTDGKGLPVKTPLNPVTRTFKIEKTPVAK